MYFSGLHVGSLLGFEATGKHIGWHGCALFDIINGKVSDLWVLGDVNVSHKALLKERVTLRTADYNNIYGNST